MPDRTLDLGTIPKATTTHAQRSTSVTVARLRVSPDAGISTVAETTAPRTAPALFHPYNLPTVDVNPLPVSVAILHKPENAIPWPSIDGPSITKTSIASAMPNPTADDVIHANRLHDSWNVDASQADVGIISPCASAANRSDKAITWQAEIRRRSAHNCTNPPAAIDVSTAPNKIPSAYAVLSTMSHIAFAPIISTANSEKPITNATQAALFDLE
jgi:hypothetical protein